MIQAATTQGPGGLVLLAGVLVGCGAKTGLPLPSTEGTGDPVTTVALGTFHSCGVRLSGTAACWGFGATGVLGNGRHVDSSIPTPVLGRAGVLGIAAADSPDRRPLRSLGQPDRMEGLSCAVDRNWEVSCWGSRYKSGWDPDQPYVDRDESAEPHYVGSGFAVQVAVATNKWLIRLRDGEVLFAGDVYILNSTRYEAGGPSVPLKGITNAESVVAGEDAVFVRRTDGRWSGWGQNRYGTLATGDFQLRWPPETTVADVPILADYTQIATKFYHACAIHRTGTVDCWGCVDVLPAGAPGEFERDRYYCAAASATPVAVAGIGDADRVAVGRDFSCVLRRDRTVWCWGKNGRGQLGDGTRTGHAEPREVPGLRHVVAIEAGAGDACARNWGGTWFCWGANDKGRLGDGTREDRLVPTEMDW